jgi:predicted TIM-barrel enzyme
MEDAQKVLVGAKPDIFCFHAGTTKGGLVGFDSGESIEETAKRSEEAYTMARDIHPEVLLVGHGAAMETPEDAAYMLAHTSGHGIWTGSSTERLPIEKAVFEAASAFANLEFPS